MLVELEALVLELEAAELLRHLHAAAFVRARCGRKRIMQSPWCQVGM